MLALFYKILFTFQMFIFQALEGVIKIIEVAPEPSEANEFSLSSDIAINEDPITENAVAQEIKNVNDEDSAVIQPSTETIEVQTWQTTNDFLVPKNSTDSGKIFQKFISDCKLVKILKKFSLKIDITYELTETIDNTGKVENNAIENTTANAQGLVTVDVNPSTATPNNLNEEDTTVENFEKSETTPTTEASHTAASPEIPKPCSEVGIFPHDTNCNSYYTCIAAASGLQRVDHACPIKSAFNDELKRCARDISFCSDDQACLVAGSYEDTQSNATYYRCVPRLTGGFHKYRIDCRAGEVFVSQLGKCFIDMNNLQNLPINFWQDNGQLDDEHIVKMELKEFKTIDKAKFKVQKLKEKLEKKLQEQLAKKAAKDAKETSKAEKSKKI